MISEELQHMEKHLSQLEQEQQKTHSMVVKIYGVLIGDEFNKNDSMQAKILTLQEKVSDLEQDKVKRDAKMAVYLVISSFAGTIIGALLIAWLTTFMRK